MNNLTMNDNNNNMNIDLNNTPDTSFTSSTIGGGLSQLHSNRQNIYNSMLQYYRHE